MTKILGTVRQKSELQKFQNTDFTKVDLVIQDANGTPYKLEFHKENTDLIKDVILGQELVVFFKIRGNFYDKKDSTGKPTGQKEVSNSLVAYKVSFI